jgi:sugar phosphate isomerase/epimerase
MTGVRPIVPDLIASCWTAGGDADAVGGETPSPVDLRTRIETASKTGWRGFGLMYPDLVQARATIGYRTLRQILESNGMLHVELEYLEDWWETGARRAASDARRAELFAAAEQLGARHLKVGAGVTERPADFQLLVDEWASLCEDAAAHGVRIAIEAAPYSHLPTVESMVRLVSDAGNSSGGVLLDIWHVFRSGTDYETMAEIVPAASLFAVELSDAVSRVQGTLREDTVHNRLLCGEGEADVPGFIRAIDLWQAPRGHLVPLTTGCDPRSPRSETRRARCRRTGRSARERNA